MRPELSPCERVALYLHVPFCTRKCDYCDFFSEAGRQPALMEQVTNATLDQAAWFLEALGQPTVTTLFVGGGTPTCMPLAVLRRLLSRIAEMCRLAPLEWTVEANPETLSEDVIKVLQDGGVTRLSVGVQTFQDPLFHVLGRAGSRRVNEEALSRVALLWTGQLSVDLITSVPSQTPDAAETDVDTVSAYSPDHVSLYVLTVEEGTLLHRRISAGEVTEPDPDRQEEVWSTAIRRLAANGFQQYEVSNFARNGRVCRHNLAYWRMHPYAGCGPSAVSTLPGHPRLRRAGGPSVLRLTNPRDSSAFALDATSDWSVSVEAIAPAELYFEHLMMGLRLTEGVSCSRLARIFGIDPVSLAPQAVFRWTMKRLMRHDGDILKMTTRGLRVLDSFLRDFLQEAEMTQVSGACWPDEHEHV